MNKYYTLALLPILAATMSYAQPGLIKKHPASNPGGKLLTMEEAVLERSLYPSISSDTVSNLLLQLKEEGIDFSGQREEPCEFTEGRSLYYLDSEGNRHIVAESEGPEITYGQIVSRNEFGINAGTFWSPDKTRLAYYRNDESLVTTFPLLDITTRTGTLKPIKYPMNGMDSERVTLRIFNTADESTVEVKVTDFGEDRYLTNVSWSPDSRYIFIMVLDRSQKHLRLNQYKAADGSFVRTILTEESDKYVENVDPLRFIGQNSHFIYRTSNRDGYKNLYLCDTLGTVRRITAVDADVALYGIDKDYIYYTSAEVSPVENHLFRLPYKDYKGRKGISANSTRFGKPERLTAGAGWHEPLISRDRKWLLDIWSSVDLPLAARLVSLSDGKEKLSFRMDNPLGDYANVEVDFGSVKSADGRYDNYYRLLKPLDFDPEKKYPVVVYVYGGPHSQMVRDSWLGEIRYWEFLMAQRGYIVYAQDNRGTENRGLEYEQAIHRHCGQAEMADQMEGVKMLKSLPYVDADRIGVHGWSYGGFMTISLITTYPDVFKVAVAGGPVIDWKWYEVMYGERYMETEATNPEGFRETSLINKAKDLKGKLLICQGAIDNTCVWQHSLSFVRACIDANVQLDYFPYPLSEHNMTGKTRVHLMDKVTEYFDNNL
ncbi:MAG: DPP IV N-terminal domain-containing protein [Bacteroidales bacterium]|nr:DPP IV N-terminal domain-containing protein [Bacteroidales bacterium]